jgi:hypothetical protein
LSFEVVTFGTCSHDEETKRSTTLEPRQGSDEEVHALVFEEPADE